VQEEPLGTGDAARSARPALAGYSGDVLVLSGDTPLLTPELLRALLETHRAEQAAATIRRPHRRGNGRDVRRARDL